MEFSTQRELLEYLGKCPEDRSLVQRMIIRGEVLKENGMYYLVNKDEKIKELEILVAKLRSEIATMKESNWDLTEAKIQWEYWEKQAREYAQYCADIVEVCYKKIKQEMGSRFTEDKETFKEWIQRMVKWEE